MDVRPTEGQVTLRRIRILFAELPRMLCYGITDLVAGSPDMEIVGDLPTRHALASEAHDARADVVLLGVPDAHLPPECTTLFQAQPRVRVIRVAADGRWAFLDELCVERQALGEVSPRQLIDTIHGAAAREPLQN